MKHFKKLIENRQTGSKDSLVELQLIENNTLSNNYFHPSVLFHLSNSGSQVGGGYTSLKVTEATWTGCQSVTELTQRDRQ